MPEGFEARVVDYGEVDEAPKGRGIVATGKSSEPVEADTLKARPERGGG